MRSIIVISILIFLIVMVSSINSEDAASDKIYDISLIQLIASPDKYHKKQVRVVGVGSMQYEGTGLFLTKEHYNHTIAKNAIWLNVESNESLNYKELQEYNGKYVFVEGIFNKNIIGHFGMYSGGLEYVISYKLIPNQ